MKNPYRSLSLVGVVLWCLPAALLAQGEGSSSADELARLATDPTASLMSLNFIGKYAGNYRDIPPGEPDDSSELTFRPVIPFTAFGQSHILRVSVPYNAGGRGPGGLGPVSVFDLVVQDKPYGRLGLGGVALISREGTAPDEFAIGPAVGVVHPVNEKLSVGMFNQNLLASDTSISQFQPIVTYQLGNGWSLSAGDAQWIYDWKASKWLSQPIGVQLGKVTAISGQPIRWAVNPQFDLVDEPGTSRWSLTFTFTMLVPGG